MLDESHGNGCDEMLARHLHKALTFWQSPWSRPGKCTAWTLCLLKRGQSPRVRRCVCKIRRVECQDTAILLVFEQERVTTFEACAEQEDTDYAEQAS